MHKTRRSLIGLSTVGLAALTIILAGCSSPSGSSRTGHQAKSDRETASEVKKALADAPVFKYPDVDASAFVGTVQLTGFVQTQEQRESAAEIAAKVKGVDRVINGIMIVPVAAGGATIQDSLADGLVTGGTNQVMAPRTKVQPTGEESGSKQH
jgi:hyperosmotically inducible periplasmic protein